MQVKRSPSHAKLTGLQSMANASAGSSSSGNGVGNGDRSNEGTERMHTSGGASSTAPVFVGACKEVGL
jgi:hypothetical protein